MNRSNSAPSTPTLREEEDKTHCVSRKRKLNFVLGQLRRNGRRRSSSEPTGREKQLSSTVHEFKKAEAALLFGGKELCISPIQPPKPKIKVKVFKTTPEHFPDFVRETRASSLRKQQLAQAKVYKTTPEHFPDFCRRETRASSSASRKPFVERVEKTKCGKNVKEQEPPGRSGKAKAVKRIGSGKENANKRKTGKPKPSMKRKREVRAALKEARENLKVSNVLDYTPLRGIKKATDLSFLNGLSPISFGTPEQKRKKVKVRDDNKITPTNRADADRYLVQLGKGARDVPKCAVPSTQPSDSPGTSDVAVNLSKILEKSKDPTDDEEEVDEYFD